MMKKKYHDFEDLVYRMKLTHGEFMDVLHIKYTSATSIGYTLPRGICETSVINLKLKSLLPDEVELIFTKDAIRLKSNLTTDKTKRFFKKSIFYTTLGFTQSYSGPLSDIEGFVQKIPGKYKSEKPDKFTGVEEVDLNCDCINVSIVNGFRVPFLYNLALDEPPGHKSNKEPRINFFKQKNKSVLSHITFSLENEDQKAADFNRDTIPFTCQIKKV